MMAEHTARTFEAVDVLLRETATDLSHSRRDWENWEASRGWEYIAQRHSRAMPQLRDLIIFDARATSASFPPISRRPASMCATAPTSLPWKAVPRARPTAPTSAAIRLATLTHRPPHHR
jgi:hypothetical protein